MRTRSPGPKTGASPAASTIPAPRLSDLSAPPCIGLLRKGCPEGGAASLRVAAAGGRESPRNLGLGEAGCDVLRAIPVEGLDLDQEGALDHGAIIRHREPCAQRRIIVDIDGSHPAKDLETAPVGIIHQEERHTIIEGHVAGRDVLPIAAEIGEAEFSVGPNAKETGRAAPELHVGPASLGDRGDIEAVTCRNEFNFHRPEPVVRVGAGLTAHIGAAAPHRLLHRLNGRGERDVRKLVAHSDLHHGAPESNPWTSALQPKFAQPRMFVGPPAEGPMVLALARMDRKVVDARDTPPHQAALVELPVLVAVGAEPVARVVVPLVGEADGDPVLVLRPEFLDEPVIQFAGPLATEKGNYVRSPDEELGAVSPAAILGVGERYVFGVARVPGILRQTRLSGRCLGRERRERGAIRHFRSPALRLLADPVWTRSA